MSPATLTTGELRALLGYRDARHFRQQALPRLLAQGFPPPLPGLKRRAWSRPQVEAWLAMGGRPAQLAAAAATPEPRPLDELEAARARLKARSAARSAH